MPFFTLIQDTVQVLRAPTTTDDYHSTIRDWDNATVVATALGSVQPSFSAEIVDDRQTTTSTWRLIAADPVLFDVEPTDRILWQDKVFDVDSAPLLWRWRNADHHVEIYLREVNG